MANSDLDNSFKHASAGTNILCLSEEGKLRKINWVEANFVLYTRVEMVTCPLCRKKALEILNIKEMPSIQPEEIQDARRLLGEGSPLSTNTKTPQRRKKVLLDPLEETPPSPEMEIGKEEKPREDHRAENLPPPTGANKRKFYDGVDISPGKSPYHVV